MRRWKWMLATAALMVGLAGGAFAEEQHWGDRRGSEGTYTQRDRGDWNYNRNYGRNNSYRNRDGDRDDQGYWRQSQHRDYRDQGQFPRDRDDRGRD